MNLNLNVNEAVLADGFGLRTRLAELFRRLLGDPLVVQRKDDPVGSHRRARVHLPVAGADDAREPQQGSQRLHRRATDQIPQPQHARLPRFSGFIIVQHYQLSVINCSLAFAIKY